MSIKDIALRLQATDKFRLNISELSAQEFAEAIDQLERQLAKEQHDARGFAELYLERGEQLAERDAEIAKYRDAPVVAWTNEKGDITQDDDRVQSWIKTLGYTPLPLIVKPGEQ